MKPGVPDATAHPPRPQSPDCSTALPRWWDMVVTKNSLPSPALPPLDGHCLPLGEIAQPGPRGRTSWPASDRFSTCPSSANPVDTSPLQWEVAILSCGWKRPDGVNSHRFD